MKKINNYFISIITVVRNDSEIIIPFFKETMNILEKHYENYEFIIIDDGSTDSTAKKIYSLLEVYGSVRFIRLSRSSGVEIALSAGLDAAIGDVIVTLEPESDPPQAIPLFVSMVINGDHVVMGIQKNKKKYLPLYYRIGKSFYHYVSSYLLKFNPPKDCGYFIAISRQTLNQIISIKDRSRFLRIFSSQLGYKIKEIRYSLKPRRNKIRKKQFKDSVDYAINALVVNSTFPLRIVVFIGLAGAVINIVYILYIFMIYFFKDEIAKGWTTTSLQISGTFIILCMMFAIFSEYLIRFIDENKQEPTYHVIEERNSNVMLKSDKRNVYRESL